MSKSREILAGFSLFTAISAGAAACSGASENAAQHSGATEAQYTVPLKKIARNILELAKRHNAKADKPPYTLDFSVPTTHSGSLGIQVQTSTPQHELKSVDSVSISQSIPANETDGSTRSFNLLFYALTDGRWDVFCADNAARGGSLYELDQSRVYAGKELEYTDPAIAGAFLSDTIHSTEDALWAVFAADRESTEVGALKDPCHANFG